MFDISMEFVFLPSLSFGLSGFVIGNISFKITVTLISVLIKGSTKWCLIVYAFVVVYVIVNCALAAISISFFRSLNVFFNFLVFISL